MNTNFFPKKSIIKRLIIIIPVILVAALAIVAFPDQEAIILGIAIMFVVSLQLTNHFHSRSIARQSISPMSGPAVGEKAKTGIERK